MEQLNVQLNRLTRSLRRARTVELPEGEQIRFRILFIHLCISEKYRISLLPELIAEWFSYACCLQLQKPTQYSVAEKEIKMKKNLRF